MSRARSLLASPTRKPHFTDWLLRLSLAGLFLAIGLEKFAAGHAGQEWVTLFARLGLGQWFRYFTGAVEALGGILMLVPRATLIGAGLLASAMIGAITAHLFVLGDPFAGIIPAVLLGIVVAITLKLRAEPDEPAHLDL
jgi:uncharacterized membrane protein YphA (DoxX/SURF4 family)